MMMIFFWSAVGVGIACLAMPKPTLAFAPTLAPRTPRFAVSSFRLYSAVARRETSSSSSSLVDQSKEAESTVSTMTTTTAATCPLNFWKAPPKEPEPEAPKPIAAVTTTHTPKQLPRWTAWRFLWTTVRGTHHQYLYRLMQQHGDNYMIAGNTEQQQHIVLHDVHAIRDVLETYNLEKTLQVKRGFKSLFYRKGGILAAPWNRWVQERRMTAPALTERVIGDLAPKLAQGAKPVLALLHQTATKASVVEMDAVFTALTMDTIGLILLGRSFGMGDRLLQGDTSPHPFSQAIQVVSRESLRQMMLPPSLLRRLPVDPKLRQARQVIDDVLEQCIAARLHEREETAQTATTAAQVINTTTTDLMNILLNAQAKGDLSRDDVKGQLLLFLFAGHDTTAHTLTWLLYQVARNDELQQALYQEAKAALKGRNDFILDSAVFHHQLPLHDAVWMETNRLHPAAATGTTRRVGSQPIVVGKYGLELPARASVSIPPYSLHRNEKLWPNATVFDPSRFMNKDSQQQYDPMAFQAFSAGPRTCLGARLARAEALSVTSALFRRFRVQLANEKERFTQPAEFMSLTLRPKHGIRFRFQLRQEPDDNDV